MRIRRSAVQSHREDAGKRTVGPVPPTKEGAPGILSPGKHLAYAVRGSIPRVTPPSFDRIGRHEHGLRHHGGAGDGREFVESSCRWGGFIVTVIVVHPFPDVTRKVPDDVRVDSTWVRLWSCQVEDEQV